VVVVVVVVVTIIVKPISLLNFNKILHQLHIPYIHTELNLAQIKHQAI
jgi:hypothetical protein